MPSDKTNQEAMAGNFATIGAEAGLKEAYLALKKNLEGPPHSPGLVVVDEAGKFAGVLTMDDFMGELARLHRAACDKPGRPEWLATFFSKCKLIGFQKVAGIMSGKRLLGAPRRRLCSILRAAAPPKGEPPGGGGRGDAPGGHHHPAAGPGRSGAPHLHMKDP